METYLKFKVFASMPPTPLQSEGLVWGTLLEVSVADCGIVDVSLELGAPQLQWVAGVGNPR